MKYYLIIINTKLIIIGINKSEYNYYCTNPESGPAPTLPYRRG
jgi:hypothetical protein